MKKIFLLSLFVVCLGFTEWHGDTLVAPHLRGAIDTTDVEFQTYVANHAGEGGGGVAFPVGSVFLSVVATNPGTLLGYGTWTQIAEGQFLVGQSDEDEDFDVAEEMGGSKSHTHDSHDKGSARSGSGATLLTNPTTHSVAGHVPPYFVIYVFKRTN